MNCKKWRVCVSIIFLFLLSACGGGGSSSSGSGTSGSTQQIDGVYMIDLSKVYSDAEDYEDDIRASLVSTGITSASKVSVDIGYDESSSLNSDPSNGDVRLEMQAVLDYVDSSDDSNFFAVVRLRLQGDGVYGQAFIEKCFNGSSDCHGIGDITDEPLDLDLVDLELGDTVNISIEWLEEEQMFIANIGEETTIELYLADLNNDADIIANGGFDFGQHIFSSIQLSATVRNILLPGESGELLSYFDNAAYDGIIYDNFESSSLDTELWNDRIFEF